MALRDPGMLEEIDRLVDTEELFLIPTHFIKK